MQETNEKIVSSKKPKKWRRRLMKLFLAFVIFNLIIEIIMYFFATPILKKTIKGFVQYKSNGLYSVDFEKIKVEMASHSISIKNIVLKPDTLLYNKYKLYGITKTALYEISIKSFDINSVKLYKLLFKKELFVNSVVIDKPQLHIISLPGNKKVKKDKYDAVHNDLYPAVSKLFKTLSINRIEISNGLFDLFIKKNANKQNAMVNNISIVLENFLLDSTEYAKHNKLFYSENIELVTKDYKVASNDNMHTLSASEVSLSTKRSEIKATFVRLAPSKVDLNKNISKNLFDLFVPQILIKGFDLNDVFFKQTISINSITLSKPILQLLNLKKKSNKTGNSSADSIEHDLYKLVYGKIDSLAVDTFRLIDCSFKLFKNQDKINPQFSIGSLSIFLYSFDLNAESERNNNKILLADNIDVQMKDYKMRLADNTHYLFAKELGISTQQKHIYAQGVMLAPLVKMDSSSKVYKSYFDVKIPYADLKGIDLISAYNSKILPVNSLTLNEPSVKISRFGDTARTRTSKVKKISDLYALTSAYLYQITINEIILRNGYFDVSILDKMKKKSFFKGNINLSLHEFSLDESVSNGSEKFFYSNQVDVTFSNYAMKLPKNINVITADKILISTTQSLVDIANLSLDPIFETDTLETLKKYGLSSLLNLKIKGITINNLDIHQAYYKHKLRISDFMINDPIIKYINYKGLITKNTSDSSNLANIDSIDTATTLDSVSLQKKATNVKKKVYQLIADYFDVISVSNLNINNGLVNISSKDSLGNEKNSFSNRMNVVLRNFYIDKDSTSRKSRFFFSDDITVNIFDYTFFLPDKIHKAYAKELTISTEKSQIFGKTVTLSPIDLYEVSGLKKNSYLMYFPFFKFSGFNFPKALSSKEIEMDSLVVENPVIQLSTNIDTNSVKKRELPIWFKGALINHLIISKGHLSLTKTKGHIINIYSKADFDLNLNRLKILPKTNLDTFKTIQYENANIVFKNFVFNLPDSIHFVKASRIQISTNEKDANIKDFEYSYDNKVNHIAQLMDQKKTLLIDFATPEINFRGLNLGELIFNKNVIVENISMLTPTVNVKTYPHFAQGKKEKTSQLDFFKIIKGKMNSIAIKNIDMEHANLNYTQDNEDDVNTQVFKNFDCKFNNFLIDSLSKFRNRLFSSEDIRVKLRDISKPIPQDTSLKYYIKEINLSTRKSSIDIQGFSIRPDDDKFDYAKKYGYRKSAMYIMADLISVQQIDLPKLIDNKIINTNKILINNLHSLTFLDKHLPDTLAKKRRMIPQEFIQKMKLKFSVDTIQLNDSYVGYEEFADKGKNTGTISFEKINSTITNLSNDSIRLLKTTKAELLLSCYLMGKTHLSGTISMPVSRTDSSHNLYATLDSMSFAYLNPFIENIAFVSINNGSIKNLSLEMSVNPQKAEGGLTMLYNNLKISLINNESKDSIVSKKGIFSALANMLLPANNPKREKRKAKEGNIYVLKSDSASTVLTMWNMGLLNGIKSTFGFETKEYKESQKLKKKFEKLINNKQRKEAKIQRKFKKEAQKKIKNLTRIEEELELIEEKKTETMLH